MIKGVPEELQIAYNKNPEQYDLLGVMADAADEAGELEVGEALRWLWRWKVVPDPVGLSGLTSVRPEDYRLENIRQWAVENELEPLAQCYWMGPTFSSGHTASDAINRLIEGFLRWKAQHSEEYHRLSVPPSTLTPQTTPS